MAIHNSGEVRTASAVVPDTILNADDEPQPKRRKIPLACNVCRDRKTRCDGRRPTCSTCGKKGTSDRCAYEESSLITQRYVSNLENRVKELEKNNGLAFGRELTGIIDLASPVLDGLTDYQSGEGAVVEKRIPTHKTHFNDQSRARERSTTSSDNDMTAVGDATVGHAMHTLPSSEDDARCLFGGSSSIAFVRSMMPTGSGSDATSEMLRRHFNSSSNAQYRHKMYRGQAGPDSDIDAFALPRRRAADNYVECFWEYVNPVFPILHKTTFNALYQTLWLSESERDLSISTDAEDPVFLSTLNIVFAIGCQFSEINAPSSRTSLAEQFYQQSRKLVAVDALDSTSLPIVQMLLLTGVYLHSTKYASRCWNIVGLAIRNAQGIGLHIEHVMSDSRNQVEREIRRRTWHSCIVLDRLLALVFGRPNMISTGWNVPLPLIVDDEYLLEDGEGSQPSHSESRMGLFVYSIKLFDIMNDVLSTCYFQIDGKYSSQDSDAQRWSHQRLDDVLRLNSALENFLETLPSHLRIQEARESPGGFESNWSILQAKVLYSRFLYVRALLLRPILLSAVQQRNDPLGMTDASSGFKFGKHVALGACTLCVETVHSLITQIYENLHIVYLSPGWHTVHYTFACAIVLVAAGLCSIPGEECSKESLETSWSRCITILEHYKPQIPSASHAIQVLEKLHRLAYARNDAVGAEATRVNLDQLAGPSSAQNVGSNKSSMQDLPPYDMFDFNINSLSDAWFAQQLVELDWPETF